MCRFGATTINTVDVNETDTFTFMLWIAWVQHSLIINSRFYLRSKRCEKLGGSLDLFIVFFMHHTSLLRVGPVPQMNRSINVIVTYS